MNFCGKELRLNGIRFLALPVAVAHKTQCVLVSLSDVHNVTITQLTISGKWHGRLAIASIGCTVKT